MDRVREETGLQDIEQFVTTAISTFEEQAKLTNYILRLNDDIDEIERDLDSMTKVMTSTESKSKKIDSEKSNNRNKLKTQAENLQNAYNNTTKHSIALQAALDSISPSVRQMKQILNELNITLPIDQKLNYDEAMILNHKTTQEYLFELEQLIAKFLVYIQNKKKNPAADLVMLDVNLMQPKEFATTGLSIRDFVDKDILMEAGDDTLPMTPQQFQRAAEMMASEKQSS